MNYYLICYTLVKDGIPLGIGDCVGEDDAMTCASLKRWRDDILKTKPAGAQVHFTSITKLDKEPEA